MRTSFEYKGRKVEIRCDKQLFWAYVDGVYRFDRSRKIGAYATELSANQFAKQLIDAEEAK
jgi:hypothetical protein